MVILRETSVDHQMVSLAKQLTEALGLSTTGRATAIQTVFALAVADLRRVFRPNRFDEESITSAFVGALASHATWVTAAFDSDPTTQSELYWAQYKKSSTKTFSEAKSGADFALVVRVSNNHALLSLFQAKIADDSRRIDIYRRPAIPKDQNKVWRSSQLVVLVKHSRMLLAKIRGVTLSSTTIGDLDWVHYLAYENGALTCVPVSGLQGEHNDEVKNRYKRLSSHMVAMTEANTKPLFELLDLSKIQWERSNSSQPMAFRPINLGAAAIRTFRIEQPEHDHYEDAATLKGWLSLTYEEAEKMLPLLTPLMGVYVADETRSGGARRLNPDLEFKQDFILVDKKKSSDLSSFFKRIIGGGGGPGVALSRDPRPPTQ